MSRLINRLPTPTPIVAILILISLNIPASADHGGPTHTDFGMILPSTSDTGDYTVTWNSGYSLQLQEKVNGGTYVQVYWGQAGTKSFTGKADGTYTYRNRFYFCYYSCTELYSAPHSIVVNSGFPRPDPITGPDGDLDGTFSISWGSVTEATHYELERRITGGTWVPIAVTNVTTRNESGLGDGVWEYRVKACDASECSSWASPNKMVSVAPAPGVPGAITAPDEVPATSPAYSLSWTIASGPVTSYELQESPGVPGNWMTVQNTLATTKYISGKNANSYFYRVRACNTAGAFSACSPWTSNKLVDIQNFINVSLSAPAVSTTGSFTVTWYNPTSNRYTLQESVDGGAWTTAYFGSAESYALTGKAYGSYRYRIRRIIMRGRRFEPEPIIQYSYSVTTRVNVPKPPSAPANFATDPAPTEIGAPAMVSYLDPSYTVRWNAVADASSYELEERVDELTYLGKPLGGDGIGVWTQIYSGPATSVEINKLKIQGTFSYQVRACNAALLCSAWSPARTVTVFFHTVPPSPPRTDELVATTWSGFNSALESGDVAAAMQHVMPGRREEYETALLALGSDVQWLTTNWSAIKEIRTTGDFAEYTVFETVDGVQLMHIIMFQRADDGTWKLAEF